MSHLLDTTPTWILAGLIDAGLPGLGHPQPATHRREKAAPRWCHCGRPVWTGACYPDLTVKLDPTPTTPHGELFSILTNRPTYELHGRDIQRRRPAHIETATADQIRVYLEHRCEGPNAIPNPKWTPPIKPDNDNPPY